MNSAWDWRGRAEELRSADGSDEAKARQYGAATKLLKSGIHGDKSAWRNARYTELDALADTIRDLYIR